MSSSSDDQLMTYHLSTFLHQRTYKTDLLIVDRHNKMQGNIIIQRKKQEYRKRLWTKVIVMDIQKEVKRFKNSVKDRQAQRLRRHEREGEEEKQMAERISALMLRIECCQFTNEKFKRAKKCV